MKETIHEQQRQLIKKHLSDGFLILRFAGPIEIEFIDYYRKRAISSLRYSVIYALFFYFLMSIIALGWVDSGSMWWWSVGHVVVGFCLLAGGIMVYQSVLEDYQQIYCSVFIGLSLVMLNLTSTFVSSVQARQFIIYCIMFILIVLFTFARVRFVNATMSWLLSAAFYLGLSWPLDYKIVWLEFLVYYIGTGALGGAVAYMLEHSERSLFLQGRLSIMEKQSVDQHSQYLTAITREDSLTGLINRRGFDEMLIKEWRRCRREATPLSLLFVEIDFFENFSAVHGLDLGSSCFQKVGFAIGTQVARTTDIVARYSGREFSILLPNTSEENAVKIGHRILNEIDRLSIPHDNSPVSDRVTVSVGFATIVPSAHHNPDDLRLAADRALLKAKGSGCHCLAGHAL